MKWQEKKAIYYLFWFLTGVGFGFLLGAITELTLVKGDYNFESLSYYLGLSAFFGLVGLYLAPKAWRMIYVKGKRGKKYVIKGAK